MLAMSGDSLTTPARKPQAQACHQARLKIKTIIIREGASTIRRNSLWFRPFEQLLLDGEAASPLPPHLQPFTPVLFYGCFAPSYRSFGCVIRHPESRHSVLSGETSGIGGGLLSYVQSLRWPITASDLLSLCLRKEKPGIGHRPMVALAVA